MPFETVCKFVVEEVAALRSGQERIRLTAITDGTVPEDRAFTKYTPSGSMEFQVGNPAVLGRFKPDQKVLIRIELPDEAVLEGPAGG
jgi:hypothetical protein